jgi:hypothetical protein
MNKDKLIAEFMGDYFDTGLEPAYYIRSYNKEYKIEDSQFHKSWDWLMPVVEKIESLDLSEWMYSWEDLDGETRYNFEGISVEIEKTRCWIYINLSLDPYWTINEKTFKVKYETKLEAAYESVVEFIEWYNERKKREDESNT